MKSLVKFIRNFFIRLAYQEKSPEKLALSFCVGNYIAFSPFIFLHTVMVFICVWLFRLNFAVTFAAAYGVNNIWTAVPIYTVDYAFGYWLMHSVAGLDLVSLNPSWMGFVHRFFELKLGLAKPCLWSFLIGGNLLGILTSVILYPPIKWIFAQFVAQVHLPPKQAHAN